MWNIIWLSSLFIMIFSIIAIFLNIATNIPTLGIPNIVYIPLAYFSVLLDVFGHYFIFKYFNNTIEKFLNDLIENPQYPENLVNEIKAVYNDSYDHPENIYHLKRYLLFGLISSILGITYVSWSDFVNFL